MDKKEPCPGTYHYPDFAQRIETDKKDKKKSWLITYCAKCKYNYDLEEYKGRVSKIDIDIDDFPPRGPAPKRQWPHS
jgi:hypothetical protein